MTQAIADKVVMITGASSGLGEATAMALSSKMRAWHSVHDVRILFNHEPMS